MRRHTSNLFLVLSSTAEPNEKVFWTLFTKWEQKVIKGIHCLSELAYMYVGEFVRRRVDRYSWLGLGLRHCASKNQLKREKKSRFEKQDCTVFLQKLVAMLSWLHSFRITTFEDFVQLVGKPYMWAQRIGGLDFLPEESHVRRTRCLHLW